MALGYADGATLISDVVKYHENVDAADADNASLRLRILKNAQRVCTRIEQRHAWPWKIVTGAASTILASAPYDLTLPSDFSNFGKAGGVYLTDQMREVDWLPPREVERAIAVKPLTDVPNYYTELGQTTAGLRKARFYPGVSVNTPVLLTYERLPVTLTDSTVPSGLELIPAQFHDLVWEGTVMFQMKDKGDMRSFTEQRAHFEQRLTDMVSDAAPGKGSNRFIPPYGGY